MREFVAPGEKRAVVGKRTSVASRVAAKFRDALRGEALLGAGALAFSARIAGTAAAAVADLPAEAQRKLTGREPELISRIRDLVEAFGGGSAEDKGKIVLDLPREIEPKKGAGLGEILAAADGDHALNDYAVARRLEDWAGPVAGGTVLTRDYGIARSTLHHWQQNGDVIGLLKGTRKHVYPVDQFVDGRPAKGIGEITAVTANARVAWLWLSRANPALGGRKPIDLLKRDHVGEVVEAARDYFGKP